ncbi:MAG: lipid-A-disaccharide synthase [Bacteroidia bacterium]|jgi:lipid-A-disaccharide synthase|nr:lipid-A-disaccharide synthase [Bacteroidia bacterium]
MKYYLIAGEASGDLHASNLLRHLAQRDTQAVFRGWGGDLMAAQGCEIVKHYRELAFMGFTEVLMNLRTILRNIDTCKEDIERWKPDVLILVDYPGFNLRIAPFAKALGIKVIYYISPQIWAWKQKRVHKIVESTHAVLTILPFEKDFYASFGYSQTVHFVGHPLLDAITQMKREPALPHDGRPIIALLPGSRKQEITAKLPVMLECARSFPGYRFVVAGAPSHPESFYRSIMQGSNAEIVHNRTYDLLTQAHAALVTSGTATLETALFNVPQVVCYRAGAISYQIARQLVKVKYISLVNLVMDREVVRELIQHEMTAANMAAELQRIVQGGDKRNEVLQGYEALREALGGSGASAKAAQLIIDIQKQ